MSPVADSEIALGAAEAAEPPRERGRRCAGVPDASCQRGAADASSLAGAQPASEQRRPPRARPPGATSRPWRGDGLGVHRRRPYLAPVNADASAVTRTDQGRPDWRYARPRSRTPACTARASREPHRERGPPYGSTGPVRRAQHGDRVGGRTGRGDAQLGQRLRLGLGHRGDRVDQCRVAQPGGHVGDDVDGARRVRPSAKPAPAAGTGVPRPTVDQTTTPSSPVRITSATSTAVSRPDAGPGQAEVSGQGGEMDVRVVPAVRQVDGRVDDPVARADPAAERGGADRQQRPGKPPDEHRGCSAALLPAGRGGARATRRRGYGDDGVSGNRGLTTSPGDRLRLDWLRADSALFVGHEVRDGRGTGPQRDLPGRRPGGRRGARQGDGDDRGPQGRDRLQRGRAGRQPLHRADRQDQGRPAGGGRPAEPDRRHGPVRHGRRAVAVRPRARARRPRPR